MDRCGITAHIACPRVKIILLAAGCKSNSRSLEDLKMRRQPLVEYFKKMLTGPFNWTYAGNLLVVALGAHPVWD